MGTFGENNLTREMGKGSSLGLRKEVNTERREGGPIGKG